MIYESFIVSIQMILGEVWLIWRRMVTFLWELSGSQLDIRPIKHPHKHCRIIARCHSFSSQHPGYMPPAMPPAMPMSMPSWDVPAGDGGGTAAMFDDAAGL